MREGTKDEMKILSEISESLICISSRLSGIENNLFEIIGTLESFCTLYAEEKRMKER